VNSFQSSKLDYGSSNVIANDMTCWYLYVPTKKYET